MQTVQVGDTVRVRYVKRSQGDPAARARSRTPVELVVGTAHPLLPGLGLALVGLVPGETITVRVPAGQGHGPADPTRIHCWARECFPKDLPLAAGQWVPFTNRRGRRRLVRVVEVRAMTVVVDTNSRWAGRALELEVQLLGILATAPGPDARRGDRSDPGPGPDSPPPVPTMPDLQKILAFDVDRASLEHLRQAFPGWRVAAVDGATPESLDRDWDPGTASLLVVGAREDMTETLGLCRGLRGQAGRNHTPLLVLVRPAQEPLVRAALDATADSCLVLPVHPKELVMVVTRALASNQPGRHTLGLDQPQQPDPWQDDGGEA